MWLVHSTLGKWIFVVVFGVIERHFHGQRWMLHLGLAFLVKFSNWEQKGVWQYTSKQCATFTSQVEPTSVRTQSSSTELRLGALQAAQGGSTSAHMVQASSKDILRLVFYPRYWCWQSDTWTTLWNLAAQNWKIHKLSHSQSLFPTKVIWFLQTTLERVKDTLATQSIIQAPVGLKGWLSSQGKALHKVLPADFGTWQCSHLSFPNKEGLDSIKSRRQSSHLNLKKPDFIL